MWNHHQNVSEETKLTIPREVEDVAVVVVVHERFRLETFRRSDTSLPNCQIYFFYRWWGAREGEPHIHAHGLPFEQMQLGGVGWVFGTKKEAIISNPAIHWPSRHTYHVSHS